MKRKITLVLALCLSVSSAFSWDFTVLTDEGYALIYGFNADDPSAVTLYSMNVDVKAPGADDLVIPESVQCNLEGNSNTYKVTAIGEWALSGQAFTGQLVFEGNELKSVGNSAFYESTLVGDLILPESVESIGVNAFGLTKFTGKLTIGESVTSMGENAFYGIVFNDVITINMVNIPDNLFNWNTNLKGNLIIGNSVVTVGAGAFTGYAGAEVTIGSSVTSIGSGAFSWGSVKKVLCTATVPPVTNESFSGEDGMVLMIPSTSLEQYQSAIEWKDFGTIDSFISTQLIGAEYAMPFVRRGNTIMLEKEADINVYTATGHLVHSGVARQLTLPSNHTIYVLVIDNQSYKISL